MSYKDTFIQVAEDSPATQSTKPGLYRGKPTIAGIEYELLSESPYTFDQEELTFEVHVRRKEIPAEEVWENRNKIWNELFKKGQPCLRASALTKRYGWGAHYNADGKIALYGMETEEYQHFLDVGHVKVLTAMKAKRK
ncbi:MAG: DUF6157 family protein [Chloroflexota bacterium]